MTSTKTGPLNTAPNTATNTVSKETSRGAKGIQLLAKNSASLYSRA